MLIVIGVIAAFVGAFLAWYYKDGIRKLMRDFPGRKVFHGPLYQCSVYGISVGDVTNVVCQVGADETGVYLTCPPGSSRTRFSTSWIGGSAALVKAPILVPWNALRFRRKRFLLKECIRFDVPLNQSCFHIPLPIAEKLFSDAGRPNPCLQHGNGIAEFLRSLTNRSVSQK
jgi:hypothetical protein